MDTGAMQSREEPCDHGKGVLSVSGLRGVC